MLLKLEDMEKRMNLIYYMIFEVFYFAEKSLWYSL